MQAGIIVPCRVPSSSRAAFLEHAGYQRLVAPRVEPFRSTLLHPFAYHLDRLTRHSFALHIQQANTLCASRLLFECQALGDATRGKWKAGTRHAPDSIALGCLSEEHISYHGESLSSYYYHRYSRSTPLIPIPIVHTHVHTDREGQL